MIIISSMTMRWCIISVITASLICSSFFFLLLLLLLLRRAAMDMEEDLLHTSPLSWSAGF